MRYAGLIPNDVANGTGVCVSLWMQGCPHRCPGCHNPETWDDNGGMEISFEELYKKIKKAMTANGVKRNFSILGGEPLSDKNIHNTAWFMERIREDFPEALIHLWTGYDLKETDIYRWPVAQMADYIIDGPFIKELYDGKLKWRGSSNQRIIDNRRKENDRI